MTDKKASVKQKIEPGWMTHQQTAKEFDITVTALRQWGMEPIAKIGRSVYYSPSQITANRVAHFEARKQKHAPADYAELVQAEREAKLKLTEAQVEGQQLKNSQLRKELAPVAVIEWTLGKVGAQIAAILDSLPLLLKKRNAKLTASNLETIRREIVKAQNIAAQVQIDFDEFQRNAE